MFQKSWSNLKILGARRMIRNHFHNEDLKTLDATVKEKKFPGRPEARHFCIPAVVCT